jgi:hypothetical protein
MDQCARPQFRDKSQRTPNLLECLFGMRAILKIRTLLSGLPTHSADRHLVHEAGRQLKRRHENHGALA